MTKQVTVVHILVELRMEYEIADGEDIDTVVDRLGEHIEELEHEDTLNVEGGTRRTLSVEVTQGESYEVDEDASW